MTGGSDPRKPVRKGQGKPLPARAPCRSASAPAAERRRAFFCAVRGLCLKPSANALRFALVGAHLTPEAHPMICRALMPLLVAVFAGLLPATLAKEVQGKGPRMMPTQAESPDAVAQAGDAKQVDILTADKVEAEGEVLSGPGHIAVRPVIARSGRQLQQQGVDQLRQKTARKGLRRVDVRLPWPRRQHHRAARRFEAQSEAGGSRLLGRSGQPAIRQGICQQQAAYRDQIRTILARLCHLPGQRHRRGQGLSR